VITISAPAASLRYREKSSFTFAKATRRVWGSLLVEPLVGRRFRDDREDLDRRFGDVIKDPNLVHPQAVLRVLQAAKAFDPASADLRRRVT
jgi:hypothetical protein